jgi:hypothetical protein
MGEIQELDLVEVTTDQRIGLVEGARGTVVAVHDDSCTVEFTDGGGHPIGLFEIPTVDLERVDLAGSRASISRED